MARLAVTRIGEGPVKVIAAHTWLADHQTYAPMLPFLDRERFTWVFPDFRGYGGSRAIDGDFTVREMGRDLLAVADALGWERFHLVGNSMGGQAAQWLAGWSGAAGRVDGLVLLCAVPARGVPLDAGTTSFFASAVDDVAVRGQCATAVTGGRLGPGFAAHMARLSQETATREALRGYLRAWTEDDVAAEVGPFPGPVRAFVGEHDPVLTEAVARDHIVPLFADAAVATIAGTGHYPGLELPAYTAALLARTIEQGAVP
ncbi:alpha/beta fold hydrolase [Methylobacterium sp. Gmos1]